MNILLRSYLCPGDILMLTAAVRELKYQYPHFHIDVDTSHPELWYNNPYITKLNWIKDLTTNEIKTTEELTIINCNYNEAINKSNNRPYHFIHGYCQHLEDKLNIKLRLKKSTGSIFLSEEEKEKDIIREKTGWDKEYWLFNAGAKSDVEVKRWNPIYSQEVVDHFKNKIQFIQVGNYRDWHLPLKNVINLIGKTSIRELVLATHKAQGVLTPTSFLMHLSAAIKTKMNDEVAIKPTVVIMGGREPVNWERYEGHINLNTIGQMDCCAAGGCWKSKLIKEKDTDTLCKYPIEVKNELYIAKCMMSITPKKVIAAIESYFEHGLIKYLN